MPPVTGTFLNANVMAFTPAFIWAAITSYDELFNGVTGTGCDTIFGCYDGFFGYDGLGHFLFGFAAVWVVLWLCKRYSSYSIVSSELWKSALTVVAVVMLLAVVWEMLEFFRDAFLLDIVLQSLEDIRIRISLLSQPSNLDTMGDLILSLIGSLLALPFRPHELRTSIVP